MTLAKPLYNVCDESALNAQVLRISSCLHYKEGW